MRRGQIIDVCRAVNRRECRFPPLGEFSNRCRLEDSIVRFKPCQTFLPNTHRDGAGQFGEQSISRDMTGILHQDNATKNSEAGGINAEKRLFIKGLLEKGRASKLPKVDLKGSSNMGSISCGKNVWTTRKNCNITD